MPFLSTNDISLHYQHLLLEKSTNQAPLLLLSGMASDGASWQPVIGGLHKHRELIIPDNRCTGRTVPNSVETHREVMISDTLNLLDSLNIEKFSILGHSMGGMLGWAIAANAPHRVEHLIAAAALPSVIQARISLFESLSALRVGKSESAWFELLYHFLFHPDFFNNPATVNAAVAASTHYPYKQGSEAFTVQVRGLQSFLSMPNINAISCDVTMITGSHDILTTPSMIEHFAKDFPSATTHIIKDAAHALHWEQTGAFMECVLDALKR
jgi:pimeloyl-ACP methyl ester carboxylesterase